MRNFQASHEARIAAQVARHYVGEDTNLTHDRNCRFSVNVPTGHLKEPKPTIVFCDYAVPGQYFLAS